MEIDGVKVKKGSPRADLLSGKSSVEYRLKKAVEAYIEWEDNEDPKRNASLHRSVTGYLTSLEGEFSDFMKKMRAQVGTFEDRRS